MHYFTSMPSFVLLTETSTVVLFAWKVSNLVMSARWIFSYWLINIRKGSYIQNDYYGIYDTPICYNRISIDQEGWLIILMQCPMHSIHHGGRWKKMDPSRWIWVKWMLHIWRLRAADHQAWFLARNSSLPIGISAITNDYQNNSAEQAELLTAPRILALVVAK